MSRVKNVAGVLDPAAAARVGPALTWLQARGGAGADPTLLRRFLTSELPRRWPGDAREQHEVAWALGDLFEQAGLPEQARLCRSGPVHEALAVWQWVRSFGPVPDGFWRPALETLDEPRAVPPRAALSLSTAHALLESVGDGLPLTADGLLPGATVRALDDRFRWTEEFPWMRASGEYDVPPLHFLHEHLLRQRLLQHDGPRVTRTPRGVDCTRDTGRLWRAVVDPAPRWVQEFQRDALGVLSASVLRSETFDLGRIGEELTQVLERKWRPTREDHRGSVFDGASTVANAWYQLGVPLGWWDTGRGPADRRPNTFGRAAAVSVFRAVAAPPRG